MVGSDRSSKKLIESLVEAFLPQLSFSLALSASDLPLIDWIRAEASSLDMSELRLACGGLGETSVWQMPSLLVRADAGAMGVDPSSEPEESSIGTAGDEAVRAGVKRAFKNDAAVACEAGRLADAFFVTVGYREPNVVVRAMGSQWSVGDCLNK